MTVGLHVKNKTTEYGKKQWEQHAVHMITSVEWMLHVYQYNRVNINVKPAHYVHLLQHYKTVFANTTSHKRMLI